uniref:Ras-associating domain-containing protein n=1 Tax=Macrostomum lignano TaxID=282301 RepID=A0A1I8FCI8_9PLAT
SAAQPVSARCVLYLRQCRGQGGFPGSRTFWRHATTAMVYFQARLGMRSIPTPDFRPQNEIFQLLRQKRMQNVAPSDDVPSNSSSSGLSSPKALKSRNCRRYQATVEQTGTAARVSPFDCPRNLVIGEPQQQASQQWVRRRVNPGGFLHLLAATYAGRLLPLPLLPLPRYFGSMRIDELFTRLGRFHLCAVVTRPNRWCPNRSLLFLSLLRLSDMSMKIDWYFTSLYCRNLNSQARKPQTLPNRFSMRIERIGQGSEETTYLKEAYDFNANMSLLLGYPPATSWRQTASTELASCCTFTTSAVASPTFATRTWATATIERLTQPDWDSQKDGNQLRIRTPQQFFDLDSPMCSIKDLGIFTEVFINYKQLDLGVPGLTLTHHRVVLRLRHLLSSARQCTSTTLSQQEIVFNRHDITACFSRDAKQHFQLYFSLPDADETPLNEIEAAFNILINKKDIFTLLRVEGRDYTILCRQRHHVEEKRTLKSIGYSALVRVAAQPIGLLLAAFWPVSLRRFFTGVETAWEDTRCVAHCSLERLLTGEVGTGEIVEAPDAAAAVGTVGGISVGDPLLA